jgi:hypothetical protein
MHVDASALKNRIAGAFPAGSPPEYDDLTKSPSIEGRGMANFFNSKQWTEVTFESLRDGYPHEEAATMAFMTPKAFAYYLPAFMIMSIDDSRLNLSDVIVWKLLAAEKGLVGLDGVEEIASYLNDDQKRVVAEFLQYMAVAHREASEPPDLRDAEHALRVYWHKYLS